MRITLVDGKELTDYSHWHRMVPAWHEFDMSYGMAVEFWVLNCSKGRWS